MGTGHLRVGSHQQLESLRVESYFGKNRPESRVDPTRAHHYSEWGLANMAIRGGAFALAVRDDASARLAMAGKEVCLKEGSALSGTS